MAQSSLNLIILVFGVLLVYLFLVWLFRRGWQQFPIGYVFVGLLTAFVLGMGKGRNLWEEMLKERDIQELRTKAQDLLNHREIDAALQVLDTLKDVAPEDSVENHRFAKKIRGSLLDQSLELVRNRRYVEAIPTVRTAKTTTDERIPAAFARQLMDVAASTLPKFSTVDELAALESLHKQVDAFFSVVVKSSENPQQLDADFRDWKLQGYAGYSANLFLHAAKQEQELNQRIKYARKSLEYSSTKATKDFIGALLDRQHEIIRKTAAANVSIALDELHRLKTQFSDCSQDFISARFETISNELLDILLLHGENHLKSGNFSGMDSVIDQLEYDYPNLLREDSRLQRYYERARKRELLSYNAPTGVKYEFRWSGDSRKLVVTNHRNVTIVDVKEDRVAKRFTPKLPFITALGTTDLPGSYRQCTLLTNNKYVIFGWTRNIYRTAPRLVVSELNNNVSRTKSPYYGLGGEIETSPNDNQFALIADGFRGRNPGIQIWRVTDSGELVDEKRFEGVAKSRLIWCRSNPDYILSFYLSLRATCSVSVFSVNSGKQIDSFQLQVPEGAVVDSLARSLAEFKITEDDLCRIFDTKDKQTSPDGKFVAIRDETNQTISVRWREPSNKRK